MADKNSIMNENVEYGVDSRYLSNKEKKSESIALLQARLTRIKHLSKEQIIRAKLMQLKLVMENYLKAPVVYDKRIRFTGFLMTYIDSIYPKRNAFAKDIDITPVFLSQIINNHREPSDEFMLRLMIHSEMAFKHVYDFNGKIWYQVYFYEKIGDIISRKDQWKPKILKQVKLSELIN
ncbi:MAG: hypothetical protein ABI844_10310 [Saprospiraceae bacterium]